MTEYDEYGDEIRTAPKAPTKAALKAAQKEADALLAKAEPFIQAAEKLADKFGFNIEWRNKEYIPQYTPDESMWMPSNDEVEGSGYLDFTWRSSNEGNWASEADLMEY